MPTVRKLTEEEVRAIERKTLGTRKATEVEYDRYLADFVPGDYGEVGLYPDEKRLTVRNRLKAAASRHDPPLALVFQRTRGNVLRFRVEAGESRGNGAAAAESAPEAAPKKRGRLAGRTSGAPATNGRGRRRKSAEAV
ncbi:MAG TPA: hypothetical protein VNL77_14400 [Roseiflexaceae bacterium]|nr:hypothetical protein [Roseiflexaceae bacterium]